MARRSGVGTECTIHSYCLAIVVMAADTTEHSPVSALRRLMQTVFPLLSCFMSQLSEGALLLLKISIPRI
ncbi:hypothetical protein RFUL19S_04975 [Rhizobacter fulvus]